MIRTPLLGASLLLLLAACQPPAARPEAPARTDLAAEQVRLRGAGPPKGPEGACWAEDRKPAVIETVTEQVLVSPAVLAEDGSQRTAAVYRTVTQQKMVQDREDVWFRAPCPETLTPDFIATLQRALKARGLYLLPLTGVQDAPTREAVRRFQAERGLDSDQLSLAAARELGLVETDLPGR